MRGISLLQRDTTGQSRTFGAVDTDGKLFGWPYLLLLVKQFCDLSNEKGGEPRLIPP